MGACSGSGYFIDSSWRRGINAVQDDAEREYGHQEGYSGAPNSCYFRYLGEKLEFGKNTKKATEDLNKFIHSRLDRLGTGEGEIIATNLEYYGIISTDIQEVSYTHFDSRSYLRAMKKGPAVLLKNNEGYLQKVSEGTIADLKKEAHLELRRNKYEYDYYIVGKTKTYLCTGKVKQQKKTQRVTDDKVMVLPFYKFVYYGWYRE